MRNVLGFTLLALLMSSQATAAISADGTLSNEQYQVKVQSDGALSLSANGISGSQLFMPTFTIISTDKDPEYRMLRDPVTATRVPSWKNVSRTKSTALFFDTGRITTVTAERAEVRDGKLHWVFPEQPEFTLEAEVALPDQHQPQLFFRFTPRKKGWYSVGYTGATAVDPAKLDSLWQPFVWQERRFPASTHLSLEAMAPVPAVMHEQGGVTVGVAADPTEIPFRLPMHLKSRFGVLLRNQVALSQPMLFSPVLGLDQSMMEPGVPYTFRLRLLLEKGDCSETFRSLARGLYGFRDYRHNVASNLNQTLENMIEFAMNDAQSGWVADLKGFDYTTDVPGTVKNVSALHPLSIALITDNKDIYQRRALPMTEYLLSRQKYLFATREDITRQNASFWMRGPAAEVSELVSLYQMTGERNEILRHYATELYDKPRALNLNMVSEAASWQNSLALHKLTGEQRYLELAVAGANEYISNRVDKPQTDFADAHIENGGQFWTDYTPKWVDLFELYEITKDQRHLDAAAKGARMYSEYTWMVPVIPDEEIRINEGGQIGPHYRGGIPNPQPMQAPEQLVPAWQVSQVGLVPEASTTYNSNPAVFLAHHAAYMLHLGYLTNDSFMKDVARSAIVGRYTNFPGYDINGEFTNIYARPDYPLRRWEELTYNNIYYNHVWPNIALVMDFLISDAYVKSEGQINFPSRYAQGYAYLFCKVYGDRPGKFFGDTDVSIWMPRQVVSTDNIEINTITGRGPNSFYLGLMNQSVEEQQVKVKLNPHLVPFSRETTYSVRVWNGTKSAPPMQMVGGELTATVAPHGIVAFAVDGLQVGTTQFQDLVSSATGGLTEDSFAVRDSPIGTMTSMLLSAGSGLTNAFVWLNATPSTISQAMLTLKTNDAVTTQIDDVYPYEFSVPVLDEDKVFALTVDASTTSGETVNLGPVQLRR